MFSLLQESRSTESVSNVTGPAVTVSRHNAGIVNLKARGWTQKVSISFTTTIQLFFVAQAEKGIPEPQTMEIKEVGQISAQMETVKLMVKSRKYEFTRSSVLLIPQPLVEYKSFGATRGWQQSFASSVFSSANQQPPYSRNTRNNRGIE
ncbi:hypothetical protein K435DRAFT_811301 [Dendrothele bispora CBS 962.96]|uniref:Uncharacterized protein n=1 Tax=Dendrothele bispora (strain CBS 962.96) TaxID=1314807 RepID=A0A4S8KSI9_DENBC|nr:hypothetical protein K435DRAFT_811301 [Dendrothele bispora CBS 962.96]